VNADGETGNAVPSRSFVNLKPSKMKEKLILTIVDLAGDELTIQEQHALWLESNAQLVERLIHIAHWYARQYHETP